MKRQKKFPTAKTLAYLSTTHPGQDAFLAATVTLRAQDLASTPNAPLSEDQAVALAGTEFDAALHALMFPPTESRFYFLWASAAEARLLIPYTQSAWESARGEYGERQPMHYDAKRTSTNQ